MSQSRCQLKYSSYRISLIVILISLIGLSLLPTALASRAVSPAMSSSDISEAAGNSGTRSSSRQFFPSLNAYLSSPQWSDIGAATAATYTVTNTNDSGPGSLRQAILDANGNAGTDLIQFQIGTGPQTIFPLAALPVISDPVVIDGTTQSGYSGTPLIELDGANSGGADGIKITAGHSTIKGLVINNFRTGIYIDIIGSNVIEGNYIGTDKSGSIAKPNSGAGIYIGNSNLMVSGQSNNIIGGAKATARNVISGNVGSGITLAGNLHGAGNTGHSIIGNYIGATASGNAALGNGGDGVTLTARTTGITIAKNLISGNNGFGINGIGSNISASIADNYVGIDATGTFAIGNNSGGTSLATVATGGFTITNNLISGNKGVGVSVGIDSMTACTVNNNKIGTNLAGTSPISNLGDGVQFSTGANSPLNGQTSSLMGNIISGNQGNGVVYRSDAGVGSIENNIIGGSQTLGNGLNGIVINGTSKTFSGNTISYNQGVGIVVNLNSSPYGQSILSNSIFSNAGLGIDFFNNGVTPNFDCADNRFQNYPVINTLSSSGGNTTIQGTLNSVANKTFTLQFFSSPDCDPSGYGEGKTFIGETTVTTDANCVANFNVTFPVTITSGQAVTATTTNSSNWSSEFSKCKFLYDPPNVTINDVAIAEGNSGTVDAVFTVSLSNAVTRDVSLNFETVGGSATSDVDYLGVTTSAGNLTIPAGATSGTIAIRIVGDYQVEPDETFSLLLSNPVNATIVDGQAQGTILNDDIAGTLQFSAANFSGSENNHSAAITVTRAGQTPTAVTIDYATSNGTANQGTDYTVATGTLSFAIGEVTKTFTVLITDNAYIDGSRTINLSLINPTGGASLGTPHTATLTIADNDTTPATTNPIDDARFFVRQHYADFLSRESDQGGLDYWTARITQCGDNLACVNFWRSAVSAAFFIELEFQNTGSFVYRAYKASYGERPSYAQFTPDRARLVDTANLEQNKRNFALLFVQRAEFINKYPLSLDGPSFVDSLLLNVQQFSQVNLTGQRDSLIAAYNTAGGGSSGRAAVLVSVADNQTFTQAEYNKAFVLMQYFGYLRRDPDEGGYRFWLGIINNSVPNDPSGYRAMVCAFITSPEYQLRFSPITTRSDNICAPQ